MGCDLTFPGVATAVIILVSVFKTSIAAWAVLVNLSFTVFLLAIPMLLLHYWNDLHW